MNKSIVTLAGSVLVLIAAGSAGADELIINGDFEQPYVAAWDHLYSIPGWTAAYGKIEIQRGGGEHVGQAIPPGNQFVELDSDGNSSMYQYIPTVFGTPYELNFYYSPRNGFYGQAYSGNTNVIEVLWEGNDLASITATGPLETINLWEEHTFEVRANSLSGFSRLQFNAAGYSDSVGGLIDKVSLTAIPEPSTLVSLLGFGIASLLGLFFRRRSLARR